jgi:uncharacterized protein (TIGR03086 family)
METAMTSNPDLGPAARTLVALLGGITDEQLTNPTPCPAYTLGDLLDHVHGLSIGLAGAAAKTTSGESPGGAGDAARLPGDWRTRIPVELDALVEAWRDPAAWEGVTYAGPVELPGGIAGLIALDELVVHGWDVARSTGQTYEPDARSLEACLPLLSDDSPREEGGPFGTPVPVPADAPLLDRLIGLSGRDPQWKAG